MQPIQPTAEVSEKPRLALYAAVIVGGWLMVWLFLAGQALVQASSRGAAINWVNIYWISAPETLVNLVLTPLVLMFAHRFPFRRNALTHAVTPHVCAAFLFGLVHVVASYSWCECVTAARSIKGLGKFVLAQAPYQLPSYIVTYASLVLLWNLWISYARARAHEVRIATMVTEIATLESTLATAKFAALSAQLRPHFLFNALNSIAVLIQTQPPAAHQMLIKLSALLRSALRPNDANIELIEEIQFTRDYLDVERIRFQDRLSIDFHIDSESNAIPVPAFILQPLAENAIKHGVERMTGPCNVRIDAHISGDYLELSVSNTTQPKSTASNGLGIAIANTRERLLRTYGANAKLEMSVVNSVFRVVIMIPITKVTK